MNASTILQHLTELFTKSILVVSAALILTALLRRRSAALRHAVLLAALVCLVLLPLGKFAVPRWSLFGMGAAKPTPTQILPAFEITGRVASANAAPARFSWPEPARLLCGLWLTGAALLLGFRAFGAWQITNLRRTCTTPAGDRIS